MGDDFETFRGDEPLPHLQSGLDSMELPNRNALGKIADT
jgi:hypothetical protein